MKRHIFLAGVNLGCFIGSVSHKFIVAPDWVLMGALVCCVLQIYSYLLEEKEQNR